MESDFSNFFTSNKEFPELESLSCGEAVGTAEVGEKEAGNGICLRKWASFRRLGFRGRKGWN